MIPQWLSERAKHGYQKFCDGTSVHGFTELYYTKSRFWLIVWFVTIATAISLTTYMVIKSIDNFMDQPTTTSMQLAKSDDMMYPPLHICYPHWNAWVNFTKALEMGFTKESTLYVLSYMSTVYSAEHFNINQARDKFLSLLKLNNLETLDMFYRSIRVDPKRSIGFTRDIPLDRTEFRSEYYQNIKFCIVVNETDIYSSFENLNKDNGPRKSSQTTMLGFTVDYFEIGPFTDDFTNAEIERYNRDWVAQEAYGLKGADVDNLNNVNLSLIIYPNKYDSQGIYLSTNFDIYSVSIQMSIQKWKNKPDSPCTPGLRWISTDTTCQDNCIADGLWDMTNGTDFDFTSRVFAKTLTPSNLPLTRDIVFLSSETSEDRLTTAKVPAFNYSAAYRHLTKKCQNLCITGCEVYNFQYTVSSNTLYDQSNGSRNGFSKVLVWIQYPAESNVLVMTETNAQTWEGFVGNVGGLLGIWTGASILSFLQIVYLCCFTESEFGGSSSCNGCKRRTVEKQKTKINLESF